jgi:NADPH-ferrihemoprotein reductase
MRFFFFFLFTRPTTMNTMSMAENSFIKKLKSSGRSLVVFYGSQTGTGEEFAGRLAKEGMRYQLKGMVADPEECDMVSGENYCLYTVF